jgi:hemoglobin/transferrin/lactoferrin receptor protein
MAKLFALLSACMLTVSTWAQTDTLSGETEVVISASKWEQKINEVPNKIIRIGKKDIQWKQPQTAADMLQQSGTVFVQKSQLAGGSPMVRGFATNRVLLVVDGIRMNNAIYRSGNLQNVISIDPLYLQNAEVVFGPGSMVFGSDAIGGVMDFNSIKPMLAHDDKSNKAEISGNALVRFSSANKEQTYHADLNFGKQKWGYFGSVTHSDFGDQQMGKNGGQESYLRQEYVIRKNNRDSIIKNNNTRAQLFTGYKQWNVLQKLYFKPAEHVDLQYAFYYGGTEEAPRYDRLIEYRNNVLRFAEWNYGPMLWRMHSFTAHYSKPSSFFDKVRLVSGFQNYEESRIDRPLNNPVRRTQHEQVKAWNINLDAQKKWGLNEISYGLEIVTNVVNSEGWTDNIMSKERRGFVSRYPDDSKWNSFGMYGLYKRNFSEKVTLQSGLRYNYATVNATFDQTYIPFPYDKATVNDGAVTGSFGLAYKPTSAWQLNAMMNTGFRVPNIDDLGKLFESAPGVVVVPNPNLESEYAWNFELGIVHKKPGKYRFELVGFHTRLTNAMVRRPYTFNGQDSIPFDGMPSSVEALQNIGLATVWGVQALGEYYLHPSLQIYTHANWTQGKETDDTKNEQVALRSAPPFFGDAGIKWQYKKFQAEFFGFYNSKISYENLAPSERQKTFIYASDALGRPYAPAWYTLNVRAGYQLKKMNLTIALENMTNQRYRTYSSGIVAPGTNLVASVKFNF